MKSINGIIFEKKSGYAVCHIKEKQEKGQANIIDIENIKLLTEQYEELIKRKEEKTENEKA